MKIVINKCYGGFSISPEAALWLYERGFREEGFVTSIAEYWDNLSDDKYSFGYPSALKRWREFLAGDRKTERTLCLVVFTPDEECVLDVRPKERNSALLIECVETLGEKANGWGSKLRVIEIPDGVDWEIDEYDGIENIAEKHQTWG